MDERITFFGFRSLKGKNDSFVADCNPDCLSMLLYLVACDKEFDYSSIIVNKGVRPRKFSRKGALPFVSFQANRKNVISKFEPIIRKLGNPLDSNLNLKQRSVSNLIHDTILLSCCWTISFEWRWKDRKMCEEVTAPLYLSGMGLKPATQKQIIKEGQRNQLRRLKTAGRKYYNMNERSDLGRKDLRRIEDAMVDYNDAFIFGDHPTSADCLLYGMSANAIFTAINYPLPKNCAEQMLADGVYPKILRHHHFITRTYIDKLRQAVEPDFSYTIHEEESVPLSALTESGYSTKGSLPWYESLTRIKSINRSGNDIYNSWKNDSKTQLDSNLVEIDEKIIETDFDSKKRDSKYIEKSIMRNKDLEIDTDMDGISLKNKSGGMFLKLRKLVKSSPYGSVKEQKVFETSDDMDDDTSMFEYNERIKSKKSIFGKKKSRKNHLERDNTANQKKDIKKRALKKSDIPEGIASFLILFGDDLS